MEKETFKRDLPKRPIHCVSNLSTEMIEGTDSAADARSSINRSARPTKENYKRDLQKRPTKETY